MKDILEKIVELQELNDRLREIEGRRSEVPVNREHAKRHLAAQEEEYKAVAARKEAVQKDRRAKERDLGQLEVTLSKFKDQWMSVKTNREYEAVKGEITRVQEKVGELETRILIAMEEADQVNKEIADAERVFQAAKQDFEAVDKRLAEEEKQLKGAADKLKKLIHGVEKGIPKNVLARYHRIFNVRDGSAVARVLVENCEACKLRIRPQMLLELKKNEAIVECEVCQRILFWAGENPPSGGDESSATGGGAEQQAGTDDGRPADSPDAPPAGAPAAPTIDSPAPPNVGNHGAES